MTETGNYIGGGFALEEGFNLHGHDPFGRHGPSD
jgi:hypothetical protein